MKKMEGMNVCMELVYNESRKIYISKINKVQDYIESHLSDELSIDKLAKIAYFSEFHFQRIFRQITSESLYSFIKRLRLEKAVFLLKSNNQLSIQDIAILVGFSNQASFAKAFKEKYTVSASEIRKMNEIEFEKFINKFSMNGKVLNTKTIYNIPIDVKIQEIKPIKVMYIRNIGAYKGNSDLFMDLFTKLYNYANSKGLINSKTEWYAVYHDYGDLTEEEKLRLSVCMDIDINIDVITHDEFGCMELSGGKYCVGRFLLDTNEYQNAWDYMYLKWLPESGYIPDDRVCFEYYLRQENDNNSMKRLVDIYVPITHM